MNVWTDKHAHTYTHVNTLWSRIEIDSITPSFPTHGAADTGKKRRASDCVGGAGVWKRAHTELIAADNGCKNGIMRHSAPIHDRWVLTKKYRRAADTSRKSQKTEKREPGEEINTPLPASHPPTSPSPRVTLTATGLKSWKSRCFFTLISSLPELLIQTERTRKSTRGRPGACE